MQISSQTFMVTGGSSGLGGACVGRLAAAGANVVALDLDAAAGERLVAELADNVRFIQADVTDEAAVRSAVGATVDAFGGLHGLINCAGIAIAAKAYSSRGIHSLEAFEKVIQVNLVGTFNVIRLAVEAMVAGEPDDAGERGVIINTASIAAFDGQIGQAAYAASKGGIVALTLPLARELAAHGIRVVTIAPGIFDTPMLAGLPEKARLSLGQQVPFPPRLGRPEEFADLAVHILGNQMLNGEVIRLDGSIRMAPR